jgi:hypothetical protein
MNAAATFESRAERRRFPRYRPEDVRVSMPVVINTEVLDISSGGALMSTSAALHVGQRARLRMLLDREPFAAWIEVKRVELGTQIGDEHRFRVGASFTALDATSQRTLQKFVREDSKA